MGQFWVGGGRRELQPELQCLEEEASKLGLHVSWAKTKVQNLGSGHEATPDTVSYTHLTLPTKRIV